MEGVPKFKSKSCDPDHAPLGVIHHPLDSTRWGLSNKEKTKCLDSLVQKLRRGPKI